MIGSNGNYLKVIYRYLLHYNTPIAKNTASFPVGQGLQNGQKDCRPRLNPSRFEGVYDKLLSLYARTNIL